MLPAVRMVCEIDKDLLDNYPLYDIPWKPNANGICGMLVFISALTWYINGPVCYT